MSPVTSSASQGAFAASNAPRAPAGQRMMGIAELRTMVFSDLDSRTLLSLRTVCRGWHATILGDDGSRRKLSLLPEKEPPHIDKSLYQWSFIRLRRHHSTLAAPALTASTPAVLNHGLAARVRGRQFHQRAHQVLRGGCISSITVPAKVIQEVREQDIGFNMLLVNPPAQAVKFEYHFFSRTMSFRPVKDELLLSGTVHKEDGVTVGSIQTAIKKKLAGEDWPELSTSDEVELVFENVLLLKAGEVQEFQ